MKKLIAFFFLIISLNAWAQDKIVTTNSDTLDCEITSITALHVNFKYWGDRKKIEITVVSAVFYEGNWKDIKEFEQPDYISDIKGSSDIPEAESMLTNKQKNHVHSAGIFLEKGSDLILTGYGVYALSLILSSLLISNGEVAGVYVSVGGGIIGTLLIIGGTTRIRNAGTSLRSFPFN